MIEDIDFLKGNSDIDSAVVYIDSTKRDRRFYPQAEEYTLSFDQPFRNVVGFEVLDASIPTTMWNVDKYNYTIAITKCSVPSTNINQSLASSYFNELCQVTDFFPLFERQHVVGDLVENFALVVDAETFDSLDLAVQISDTIATPYFMFKRYVMTDTSVQVMPRNFSDSTFYTFTYHGIDYYVSTIDDPIILILQQNNFHVTINDNGNYDIIYFERYNIRDVDYNSIIAINAFILKIENFYKSIVQGNYDITTLKQTLNDAFTTAAISFTSSVQPDRKQGIYVISCPAYIVINANIGLLIKQLGFDTYPVESQSSLYKHITVGSNQLVFCSIYKSAYLNFSLKAPGIVNLSGYRYIIMRCKEIEDHLLGSNAYTQFSPGIGLFKLAAATADITHLRFDFVNLVRKPFHPIGKLSKLSVRFEVRDGLTYDFKGVNHQILFVLKFLVPKNHQRSTRSILNPNYNPDFIHYMSTSRNIEYKEDSDQEEEFKEEEYETKYKKDLQQYDYSSSDEEGATGDDDEDDSEVEFDFSKR